jgi:hypothetical protein
MLGVAIVLSVIMLSVINLIGIMLVGIMVSGIVLSGIILSGIMLSGNMLSGIMLSVIMLSVIIMSGIMLNVVSSSQKSYKPVLLAWHGGQVIQKGAPPLGWILRVSNEAKPLDKLGYFIIVKDFMHISEMA